MEEYQNCLEHYQKFQHTGKCNECFLMRAYPSAISYLFHYEWYWFLIIVAPLILLGSIAWIISASLKGFEMIVTDKRIYGKVKGGKRIDLPIDSISAVAIGASKSITVSSSSGKVSFASIKNRNEIHEVVSKLLVERQKHSTITASPSSSTTAEELKNYKELLDSGIITQEDFDAKKKQLLSCNFVL